MSRPEDQNFGFPGPGGSPSPSSVTQILSAIAQGDARAVDELMPLVYNELRALANANLAREASGQTLQATALVHEAYLRLVGGHAQPAYAGSRHFFAAAALAMRRILVDRAREKRSLKRGGGAAGRTPLLHADALADTLSGGDDAPDLVAIDLALQRLADIDPRRAQVVNLRYFAGLTIEQTAAALDASPATVKTDWAFARAWLLRELELAT